jgi:hypothetical protein
MVEHSLVEGAILTFADSFHEHPPFIVHEKPRSKNYTALIDTGFGAQAYQIHQQHYVFHLIALFSK